ncbi:MAG TPA: hypothetical protein VFU02_06820 [Polyangiaceae bacterium]|nr:hypothetical protein [Polyangiaceae bacterium]
MNFELEISLGPLLCMASLALACSEASSPDEPGEAATITLTDANNYTTKSELSIPTVEVAADTDISICWDELSSDLMCHEVVPAEHIDNVSMLRFLHLTEADVEARLSAGELSQSEVSGYLEYPPEGDETCTDLSNLSFMGTPVELDQEFVEGEEHVYMLVFTTGTDPGVGARSMVFVKPTSESSNREVAAPNGCELLDFEADLKSAEPVSVPRSGPWEVSWRALDRDGGGNQVPFSRIDKLLLAFYEGRDVDYLEDNIFDIELLATSIWELPLDNEREANLADARLRNSASEDDSADAGAFEGFDADAEGVWLLGLFCSTCQNPAPVLLSILEPE